MQRIIEILDKIRQALTEQELPGGYFNDHDQGTAINVAMDTAEDAAEAMRTYEQTPFQQDNFGENYLRLYGFLQAVFLQQDSIEELHERFLGSKLDTDKMPGWQAIRELRNRTTGHPVNYNNSERIFISRISLNQWSFQYQVWVAQSQTPITDYVNLKSLYEGYKQEAASVLSKIIDERLS
jgi:hypothetical protein